jgi:ADP-ribose pyrophosphatase YjhB (NUDIX family)
MPETKVAVGVIYENESDSWVLVLHDTQGNFRLPYSHQRHGETIQEATKRIIESQLGIKTSEPEVIGFRDEILQNDTHYVSFLYAAKVEEEIDIYDEKSTFDWIPLGVARNMSLQFDHQNLIKLIQD